MNSGSAGQFNGFDPRDQLGEEAANLHPGQSRTEAEVHAVPEGQVPLGSCADIKPERVGEHSSSRFAET